MYSWLFFSLIAANSHLIKLYPPSLYLTTRGNTSRKLMFLHRSEHLINMWYYIVHSLMDVRHTTCWYREMIMMSALQHRQAATFKRCNRKWNKLPQSDTERVGVRWGMCACSKQACSGRPSNAAGGDARLFLIWKCSITPRRSCLVCFFIGGRWCESRLGFYLYLLLLNSVFWGEMMKWLLRMLIKPSRVNAITWIGCMYWLYNNTACVWFVCM